MAAARPFSLDRSDFDESVPCVAIRVPKRKCGTLCKALGRRNLLSRRRKRNVVIDPEGPEENRLVILHEDVTLAGDGAIAGLEAEAAEAVASHEFFGADFLRKNAVAHSVVFGYDNLTADTVLRKLMPGLAEVPSSFESVGHIAHLNLREEHLPFKAVIGEVLLDKNAHLRTVVNKIGKIEERFRTFEMEVIAGDDDTNVTVNESGCVFKFDFKTVYWNSRLQEEHRRLISLFDSGDVVCDMMAGVGPFAIPLAKRGCEVHANDLNPQSYKCLRSNAEANKVLARMNIDNMDARDFFDATLRRGARVTRVIMNLPASAVEFLDVFKGAMLRAGWGDDAPLPMVHCYTFASGSDPQERQAAALKTVERHLGASVEGLPDTHVHDVRDVSPRKHMFCVAFRVPRAIAYAPPRGETATKRPRLQ